MSEKIEPALTPEEWREGRARRGLEVGVWDVGEVFANGRDAGVATGHPATLHALAALCLHGQPFGFTWYDVELLRSTAAYVTGRAREKGIGDSARSREVADLADRIAALLPPREET